MEYYMKTKNWKQNRVARIKKKSAKKTKVWKTTLTDVRAAEYGLGAIDAELISIHFLILYRWEVYVAIVLFYKNDDDDDDGELSNGT